MSTNPGDKKLALTVAERDRLSKLPDYPPDRPDGEDGVLLSDRIKRYCEKYQLIDPFSEELLRPAGYDLTVGRNYSILGEQKALTDGLTLEIGPYEVAIIETYETINMPKFLVGRWNIRVARAYQGLLWVGGAQVDPGFRGHLCCPIYNLSTEKVTLGFRDSLAMIDFVTTTPYVDGTCKTFPWRTRKMLIFPDYPLLRSGIEDQVEDFKKIIGEEKGETKAALAQSAHGSEQSLRSISSRIDAFLTLIFAVVAVLFTGLGIIATTNQNERSFINPPVWVAALALYLALRANRFAGQVMQNERWYTKRVFAIAVAATIGLASMGFYAWETHRSTADVRAAKDQVIQATSALAREKQDRDTAVQTLGKQVENLQREINLLKQGQPRRK